MSVALLVSCGPRERGDAVTPDAERLLCPELGGNADPLEGTYTDAPAANARIRAFVSAARGLNDVTFEIERRGVETCRQIAKQLGAAPALPSAALDVQCQPLRAAIAKAIHEGVELRIGIAPPRCDLDTERKTRCEAGLAEAGALCELQSALYSRCTLPGISFASSKSSEDLARLGRALEDNLPAMIYADMALGRRLVTHVEKIIEASAKLPAELKDAGPHGLACVGFGSSVIVKSAERLRTFLALSGAIVLDLDPELAPEPVRGPT